MFHSSFWEACDKLMQINLSVRVRILLFVGESCFFSPELSPRWFWQSRRFGEDVDSSPLACCSRIKAEL